MNDFLLDLLHDLRDKRLAPVAIALLVALVAVPVVLLNGAPADSGSSEPAASAVAARPGTLPAVQAVADGPGGSSDLGIFDPKDPFKPAVKQRKDKAADGTAQLVTPSGGAATGSGPSPGASTPAPDPDPPSARNDTSSGDPNVGLPGGPPVPGSTVRRFRRDYTYVVDVRFGQTGNERTRKGLKRLQMLPSDRDPVVVFLGVSADVKKAVFMIDSRISQSGEGTCRPSVKSCTFLYLRDEGDRNEQFLTDERGREFHLTLLDIRRVALKKSSKAARAKASRRRVGARAGSARTVRFPDLAPDVRR